MNKKFSLTYFILSAGYGLLLWFPRASMNDLCDAASNEVIFSQESIYNILFKMKWHDQSPLYFIILHFWYKLFDFGPASFKFLSSISVILSGFYIQKISFFLTRNSLLSLLNGFLFIISPLSTWLVFSGRMYPIIVFLTALLVYFFLIYQKENTLKTLFLFSLFGVFLIYTHFLGFLIVGIFFFLWALLEAKKAYLSRWCIELIKKRFFDFILSAIVIQTLVFPQILRLGILLNGVPTYSQEWSVPSSSVDFLKTIINFNILNASLPRELLLYSHTIWIYILLVVSIFIIRGFFLLSFEFKNLFFGIVIFSVYLLYLGAERVDLRDRYFCYLSPLLFVALGMGMFSKLRIKFLFFDKVMQPLFLYLQITAVILIVGLFIWMSYLKTSNRFFEYARVVDLINRFLPRDYNKENVSFYTSRGYAKSMPTLVSMTNKTNFLYAPILPNDNSSNNVFYNDVKKNKDFVFFNHRTQTTSESLARSKILINKHYDKTEIVANSLTAEIYTRDDKKKYFSKLIKEEKIDKNSPELPITSDEIVNWLLSKRVPDQVHRVYSEFPIHTSRVSDKGEVVSPIFLSTQNGYYPEWNYLTHYWNKIKLTEMIVSGAKDQVLFAHPIENSTLALIFPDTIISSGVQVVHTVGSQTKVNNDISVEVFIGNKHVKSFKSFNEDKWLSEEIDTNAFNGQKQPIIFLIRCKNQRFAHFGFRYEILNSKFAN